MRTRLLLLLTAILLAAALAGCTKKSDTAQSSSSDSLVASNPSEQSGGQMQPQAPAAQPAPPPAAQPAPRPRHHTSSGGSSGGEMRAPEHHEAPGVTVAAGTALKVAFTGDVTTETANPGDPWTGTIKENVIVGDRVVFPAGAVVHGTVKASTPAKKGDRASLELEVSSIEANGDNVPVTGSMEAVVAGSTRARNLGAIAGSAGAGALIGKAVGGNKGSLIGALIGGAAATGAVAKSKGYQVEIKNGAELDFTVAHDVTIRH